MKKFITCLAAVVSVTGLPLAAMAQTAGSKPGFYDVRAVQGWEIIQQTSDMTNWKHSDSFMNAGTTCNITAGFVGVSNSVFQQQFRMVDERAFLQELDAMSPDISVDEVGPFQVFEIDGNSATRYSQNLTTQMVQLSTFQTYVVVNNHLLVITCGSAASSFGDMLPELEAFVDKTQFEQGFTSAKIQNVPSTDGIGVVTVSEQAVSPDLLPQIAAEALEGFLEGVRADKSE